MTPTKETCRHCNKEIEFIRGYWKEEMAGSYCAVNDGPHEPAKQQTKVEK
jgi:hypothetical protein